MLTTSHFGVDIRAHLSDAVEKCDVVLVLIGDKWITAASEDGQRRLDNPTNFVRIEVEIALSKRRRSTRS